MRYTIDTWDKNTQVPYNDSRLLQNRTLPDDGTKYPYLTIGDFLEDYILWDENTFNPKEFFNGGVDLKDCYLLPLRKEFFSYFTHEIIKKVPERYTFPECLFGQNSAKATCKQNVSMLLFII